MNLFCKWLCTTENIKIAIQTCRTGTVSRGIWTHGESQLLFILKHHFVDESGLWRLSGGRNRTTFLSFDPRTDQDNGIQILCSRECFENLRCSVKSHHLSESKQVHLKLCMYLVPWLPFLPEKNLFHIDRAWNRILICRWPSHTHRYIDWIPLNTKQETVEYGSRRLSFINTFYKTCFTFRLAWNRLSSRFYRVAN